MKKKIISIILSLTLGACPSVIMAADEEYDVQYALELLNAIGITDGEISKKVSRDDFVMALAAFLYESPEKMGTVETIARNIGMLEPGEIYNGAEYISVDDAVKYAVVTLGYKPLAKEYGCDSDAYKKVAAELGISKGISDSGTLASSDCVKILYEMLETEPMSSYYKSSQEMGYTVNEGETLLSLNRDIYRVEGLQNANRYTSIYKEMGTKDGFIEIDKTEFEVEDGYTDFLGKNVVAYVKEVSDSEYKVLYMDEDENDVLTLSADDIENVAGDYSYIEYTEEDKYKKAKISPTPSVIYNGVLYGEYSAGDFMPDIGSVELIDNDMDGKYDVVNVTSYQTLVVDSINQNDMKIRNKLSFEGCLSEVELENDNYEIIYTIEKDGTEITLSDIKTYNVLSVAMSKNTDGRLVRIFASDVILNGNVTGKNDSEEEIVIDGTVYPMTAAFIKNAVGSKAVKAGESGTFYIDAFGNVAYFKPSADSEYYMILRTYEEDEKYYAIYMDMNEEWHTGVFADKIYLSGTNIRIQTAYQTDLQYTRTEIVKLKENNNGEIKRIDFAEESADYKENKFTKTPEATYTYRYYEQHFDHKYYLNEGAKAFVLPESYTTDKTKYSVQTVTSLFDTDVSGCQLSAYDVDEFNFTDVISIKDNTALENSRSTLNMFVVTEIGDMCINDELVYGIKGNMVNYRNLQLAAESKSILDGVAVGDIIRLSINGAGEVCGKEYIASAGSFVPREYVGYTTNAIMAGRVSKVDFAEGKIKIDFGANGITNVKNFRLNTTLGVLTYNVKRNKCSFDEVSSIAEGKNIICRLKMGRIEEIIIIDEE